jgi:ribonuclease P protein component
MVSVRECRPVAVVQSSMPVEPKGGGVFLPDSLTNRNLSKQNLIRKGWEFESVYSQGKRLHGKGFTLICRANADGCSRIGISVHGKIRGAVKRNRIKRIIRESFRLARERYPSHADIVFAVRPDFSFSSPSAISQSVASMLSRLTGRGA